MAQLDYRTKSASIAENSLVAFKLPTRNVISVKKIRAQGIALEIAGLMHVLNEVSASSRTPSPITISVSDQVIDTYSDFKAGIVKLGTAKVLFGLRTLLEARDITMVPRVNEAPELEEALLNHAPRVLNDENWSLSPEEALWVKENNATIVYADGSAQTTFYAGAWAWYVDETTHDSGYLPHVASSVTAERAAIAEAVRSLPGHLLIVTDHKGKMELDTRDVILQATNHSDPFEGIGNDLSRVKISTVKGHTNCIGNLTVDQMANLALDAYFCEVFSDPDKFVEMTVRAEKTRESIQMYRKERRKASESLWEKAYETVRKQHRSAGMHEVWRNLSKTCRNKLVARELHQIAQREQLVAA